MPRLINSAVTRLPVPTFSTPSSTIVPGGPANSESITADVHAEQFFRLTSTISSPTSRLAQAEAGLPLVISVTTWPPETFAARCNPTAAAPGADGGKNNARMALEFGRGCGRSGAELALDVVGNVGSEACRSEEDRRKSVVEHWRSCAGLKKAI